MASITFVDYSTVVPASWLNDVNNLTYSGQFPLTTQSWGLGAVPLTYASQGVSGYIYNAANTGAVDSNALLRIHSVNRNANVQVIGGAANEGGFQALNQAGIFAGGMSYFYSSGDWVWKTTPGGVATNQLRLTQAGSLQVVGDNSTLGYGTGSGGSVTQLTSKATGVTLNKGSGAITLNSAALAAATTVSFIVTNSLVTAVDTIVLNLAGAVANGEAYNMWISDVSIGSFRITLRNISAGSLSEALRINFTLLKGSN